MGNLLTLIREFAAYSGNGEASNNFDSVISKQEKKNYFAERGKADTR